MTSNEIVIYSTLFGVSIFLGGMLILWLVLMMIDKIIHPRLRSKFAARENWRANCWSQRAK